MLLFVHTITGLCEQMGIYLFKSFQLYVKYKVINACVSAPNHYLECS